MICSIALGLVKGLGAVPFFHVARALVSYFFPPHMERVVNGCLLSFAFEIPMKIISIGLFEPSAPILFECSSSGFVTVDSSVLLPLLWFGSSQAVVELYLPPFVFALLFPCLNRDALFLFCQVTIHMFMTK